MEKLKAIKCKLEEAAYEELEHNFECVNVAELGEVIDMIKKKKKTIYYGTIIKAMQQDEHKIDIGWTTAEDIEHKMSHLEATKKDHSE